MQFILCCMPLNFKYMNEHAKIKMEEVLKAFKPMLKDEEELYMIKNALELFYSYGTCNA
jgi:hypothetical protein